MNLHDHLIGAALQLNSDCLRIILSRKAGPDVSIEQQFSADSLRRFNQNLRILLAVWYLLKPAVEKDTFRQSKLRLKGLQEMLAPEINRIGLLDLLADYQAKVDKPRAIKLLQSVQDRVQTEQSLARMDVDLLSLLLQEESRVWRELAPNKQNQTHKILARFVRCYKKCLLNASGSEQAKESISQAILEKDRKPIQWREQVCRMWDQLVLVKEGLGDAGRERNWYLVRLVQVLERERILELLESRLRYELSENREFSGRKAKKYRRMPGKLARLIADQHEKLNLRQMKLYDCIFGQSLDEYLDFVSTICHQGVPGESVLLGQSESGISTPGEE
ncbi:MAG: hypothetical protein KUG75_08815 [Pseudomonadales bacterium]|nr:hypothetical protein [Pseudomonadales bacterium]